MSKLIVLSGVPGSGKSYFSKLLKKVKQKHVYIISSDELRSLVLNNQQDLSQDDLIWKLFYELPRVYCNDKDAYVILDACHATQKIRYENIKPLESLFDEVSLVMFKLDKQLVFSQNIERDFPVPNKVLENFYEYFQDIGESDKKLYRHIYVIKDNNSLATLIDRI